MVELASLAKSDVISEGGSGAVVPVSIVLLLALLILILLLVYYRSVFKGSILKIFLYIMIRRGTILDLNLLNLKKF